MTSEYKKAKEAFVSGMTGSTMSHIHAISLVSLASIILYSALRTRDIRPNFFCSWLLLVLPLLLSMTVFADAPYLLSLLLCLPACLIILVIPRRELGTPLPSSSSPVASSSTSEKNTFLENHLTPLPALTTYRAHMMLMTILAILAVDFQLYPRTLAKCETFGVSLMDLGVGSFVFSQGVVSAIPILKDTNYLASPIVPKFIYVTRKSLPIIVLGLVRVLLVKATDYPEHVSEYGVHWNFFLTLALLPVLQVILHPMIRRFSITVLGISLGIVHQLLLSYGHLQTYILHAPRASWVSANKEGIISLTGYLSIHLMGLSIGTLMLPPSPSWFRRMIKDQKKAFNHCHVKKDNDAISSNDASSFTHTIPLSSPRQTGKILTELCAYALSWTIFCGIVEQMEIGIGINNKEPLGKGLGKSVSRRMVNLPYILWVVAFNAWFLLSYFILDTVFYPTPEHSKTRKLSSTRDTEAKEPLSNFQRNSHDRQAKATPAPLLDAINKNGLALFLLANVCTGLINLSIRTIDASNTFALVILGIYTYILCVAAWVTREWRILKL